MISAVSRDADGGGGGTASNNSSGGGGVSEATAAAAAAPCAKAKEDKKGKNVIRGWKRDRDRERFRKDKPCDGSPPPAPPPSVFLASSGLSEHHLCRDGPALCRCAAPDPRVPRGDTGGLSIVNNNSSRAPQDCGAKSGAIVIRKTQDEPPAPKKHRGAEKVSSSDHSWTSSC